MKIELEASSFLGFLREFEKFFKVNYESRIDFF